MTNPSLTMSLTLVVALVLNLMAKLWLSTRQVRHVAQHRHAVPSAFAHTISLEAHQKAADYTLAKSKLGLIDLGLDAITLIWVLFAFYVILGTFFETLPMMVGTLPLVFPLLIGLWAVWMYRAWTGVTPARTPTRDRISRAAPIVILVVAMAFAVVRNFVPFLGSGVG